MPSNPDVMFTPEVKAAGDQLLKALAEACKTSSFTRDQAEARLCL
jgi:hypothetical protein